METISLKLEKGMLKQMEKAMKEMHYATKTEYIRQAIREKLTTEEKKEALKRLHIFAGSGGKRVITDEEYEKGRDAAGMAIAKRFGIKL